MNAIRVPSGRPADVRDQAPRLEGADDAAGRPLPSTLTRRKDHLRAAEGEGRAVAATTRARRGWRLVEVSRTGLIGRRPSGAAARPRRRRPAGPVGRERRRRSSARRQETSACRRQCRGRRPPAAPSRRGRRPRSPSRRELEQRVRLASGSPATGSREHGPCTLVTCRPATRRHRAPLVPRPGRAPARGRRSCRPRAASPDAEADRRRHAGGSGAVRRARVRLQVGEPRPCVRGRRLERAPGWRRGPTCRGPSPLPPRARRAEGRGQAVPGAAQVLLDRALGAAEGLGDVGHGHVVDVPQGRCLRLPMGQFADRRARTPRRPR